MYLILNTSYKIKMNKSKTKSLLFSVIIMLMLSVNFISAYKLHPSQTSQTVFNWIPDASLPSAFSTAATSAQVAWSKYTIRKGFGTNTNTIDPTDNVNVLFYCDFSILGFPSSGIGVTLVTSGTYTGFDMGFNSTQTYGNGSGSYNDRQGLITHEFGHVCSLNDLELWDVTGSTLSTLPTMFAYNMYNGTYAHYYFRTLTTDDINGMNYTATH